MFVYKKINQDKIVILNTWEVFQSKERNLDKVFSPASDNKLSTQILAFLIKIKEISFAIRQCYCLEKVHSRISTVIIILIQNNAHFQSIKYFQILCVNIVEMLCDFSIWK